MRAAGPGAIYFLSFSSVSFSTPIVLEPSAVGSAV